MFQGHVASTPPFSPSNKDFVPFLLPLRLLLKIIPVFTPPPHPHRSTSPSLTSSWSAADLPQPDPQVPGPPDGETCITVGLTVASAAFGSAIRPTGPNPYLTSPGTVPRPPKAPRCPSIDFFPFSSRNKETFSVTWYIIITSFVPLSLQVYRKWDSERDGEVQHAMKHKAMKLTVGFFLHNT